MPKKILLVNPWIYDFAAYDLWVKPWGLLKISSILKKRGFEVSMADALDRHHPFLGTKVKDQGGQTGRFFSEEIEKPEAYRHIPRKYRRYGAPEDAFRKMLPDDVDHILVSSGMTYWYPGVEHAISILREKYKGADIILGGIYATLSYEHAVKNSGADIVIKNSSLEKLCAVLDTDADLSFRNILEENIDMDHYADPGYSVLRISLGCPFDCSYCAQKKLGPPFFTKDIHRAEQEIRSLYERGINTFAFYDDALLYDTEYFKRYLEGISKSGIKVDLYTPNGLHAKYISEEVALLMKRTGFKNPILSLEVSDDKKGARWHNKVKKRDIEDAVINLKKAGFLPGEYTVYLLLGAPGTDLSDVDNSINFINSLGAKISLSEFSPIPQTKMALEFGAGSRDEPLMQNNSIYPSFELNEWGDVQQIKNKARRLNSNLS